MALPVLVQTLLPGLLRFYFLQGTLLRLTRKVYVPLGLLLLLFFLLFLLLLPLLPVIFVFVLVLFVLVLLLLFLLLLLVFVVLFVVVVFELPLAQRKVVACVVVVRVEPQGLFVTVNCLPQELLLLLLVVQRGGLTDVAPVVPGHGAYLRVLFQLGHPVVKAVCCLGVSFCQIGVCKIESGAGAVGVALEGLHVQGFGMVVIVCVKCHVALMHQLVFSILCLRLSGWEDGKGTPHYIYMEKKGAFHRENILKRLKKAFFVS